MHNANFTNFNSKVGRKCFFIYPAATKVKEKENRLFLFTKSTQTHLRQFDIFDKILPSDETSRHKIFAWEGFVHNRAFFGLKLYDKTSLLKVLEKRGSVKVRGKCHLFKKKKKKKNLKKRNQKF
ncbi:hypothetical protein CVS40_7367 [Lucilia cuprina]|nr:hypothetical protein CVS40_7367 [Lucilia cuprina]